MVQFLISLIPYFRRHSPRIVRIKEEHDQDMEFVPSQARVLDSRFSHEDSGAPSPSALHMTAAKKRRVTVSGTPHPLNVDVRAPPDQNNPTPISPVVIGFTVMRDDPAAIEQVRSMITVKQKQKALIEQRRGSVAGIVSNAGGGTPPTTSGMPPGDERPPAGKPSVSTRPARRSPNAGIGASNARRNTTTNHGGNTRPPSPSPITVPSQQPPSVPSQNTGGVGVNSLPPPPISFARRRAGQLGSSKKKPADIVISPRESHTQEQFQPLIQSAPPVPHAGQGAFYSGRFPMTLPRLPSAMGGGDNVRRIASGNVPPTPTRLSMLRNAPGNSIHPIAGISGRSPPSASVAIANTLVPPTPSSLHHPGYSGDKSAFLAPFEVFYDALNDSKQLKNWLSEQLQRSNTLMQTLTQQQEKLNETVDALVEKKVGGMRAEMAGLHRRVEELEGALRAATSTRSYSNPDNMTGGKGKGKQPQQNGSSPEPVPPKTYTFPPVAPVESSLRVRPEPIRRLSSPGWGPDSRDHRDNMPESTKSSPVPFEARRLSISASRLDPPRSQPGDASSSQPRTSFALHSPPQGFRDSGNPHPPPPSSKVMPSPHSSSRSSHSERPNRQSSHPRSGPHRYPNPPDSLIESKHEHSTPPSPKRVGSRRNSADMSPHAHDRPSSAMDDT